MLMLLLFALLTSTLIANKFAWTAAVLLKAASILVAVCTPVAAVTIARRATRERNALYSCGGGDHRVFRRLRALTRGIVLLFGIAATALVAAGATSPENLADQGGVVIFIALLFAVAPSLAVAGVLGAIHLAVTASSGCWRSPAWRWNRLVVPAFAAFAGLPAQGLWIQLIAR